MKEVVSNSTDNDASQRLTYTDAISGSYIPSLRSAARLTPQRTSATALFDYISAGRSTHCACRNRAQMVGLAKR